MNFHAVINPVRAKSDILYSRIVTRTNKAACLVQLCDTYWKRNEYTLLLKFQIIF